MPVIDYSKYDTNTKLIMLEEICNELLKNENENIFTPNWHLEILEEREKKLKSNND